jgi:hypothetical protein
MATPFAVSFARVIDLAKAFGEVAQGEWVGYLGDYHSEFEGQTLEFFQVGRNATHHYFLAAAEDGRIFRASLDMDAYYGSDCTSIDEAFAKVAYITDLGTSPKFDFTGAYIGHH